MLQALLISKGVKALFPIQAQTFDAVYDGNDLIGRARTGQARLAPLSASLYLYTHTFTYLYAYLYAHINSYLYARYALYALYARGGLNPCSCAAPRSAAPAPPEPLRHGLHCYAH